MFLFDYFYIFKIELISIDFEDTNSYYTLPFMLVEMNECILMFQLLLLLLGKFNFRWI